MSPAANLTEPQRTVQLFVDLVARHEERFYHFVHQVHSKGEGLFDNLMSWIELFINFVRDGLPSPVSLDFLLPVGGKERDDILAEVDALVEYHRKLKLAHHERMKKRLVKGRQDLDKDADAAFVAGVMDNLHISGVMDDVHDIEHEESDDEASDDDYSASCRRRLSPRRTPRSCRLARLAARRTARSSTRPRSSSSRASSPSSSSSCVLLSLLSFILSSSRPSLTLPLSMQVREQLDEARRQKRAPRSQ